MMDSGPIGLSYLHNSSREEHNLSTENINVDDETATQQFRKIVEVDRTVCETAESQRNINCKRGTRKNRASVSPPAPSPGPSPASRPPSPPPPESLQPSRSAVHQTSVREQSIDVMFSNKTESVKRIMKNGNNLFARKDRPIVIGASRA